MAKLDVIKHPNEILRKKSSNVDRDFLVSDEADRLIEDMIETMYEDDGVGLAAPQIGKNIRLIVIGRMATDNRQNLVLINPVWTKTSRKKFVDTEGCLSLPGTFGKVKRYKNIHVNAFDRDGNDVSFDTSGFLARVIQHEVDHLDGILFIDKARDVYSVDEETLVYDT